MDTPKRQVSWLERFPPDIWAYFAWYLPGEQLARLKMTGATLLWERLTFPQVVKSIKLGEDFIVFKSLPRFLNDFPSLGELIIHSLVATWSTQLALKLDSIPSGVRKLKLGEFWRKPADPLFGEDGIPLKLNQHLPRLESLDMDWLSFSSYSWMTHSPQSLTKLVILNWDGTVELPTSLIHFAARYITLKSTTSFVSKLPPSLETFYVLQNLYGFELIVPLFPHSIRKLCLGKRSNYSDDPNAAQTILEQLPKSLTWLQLPNIYIPFGSNPELTSLLPSTLTELHMPTTVLPCSVWHLLPRQLTNLSFSAQESLCTVASTTVDSHGVVHQEIKSTPFENLPRSITSLELTRGYFLCSPPANSNRSEFSYFPPQLTSLKLATQLSPETAKFLPSSLTLLEVGNLCERVCEHLPNSLKTLTSNATLMTPNLIKYLPESVTSLRFQLAGASYLWFDYNTGETINTLSRLAEYPTQTNCLPESFDWKDSSPLPSTLTKLDTVDIRQLGDIFLQRQQLPKLIELKMPYSAFITDLSIPLLPPYLTVLDLRCSKKVSGESFKFLPRGLTYLDLARSEAIFDCDIQHLPRTLKHAFLRHAIHLTDECIADLPPYLETLSMVENSTISTSSFLKLPYALRSSQLDEPVVFADWKVSYGVLQQKKTDG